MKKLFKRYPKIRVLGSRENEGIFSDPDDVIYVQEKIDGANGSFWCDDDMMLHFAKRSGEIALSHPLDELKVKDKSLYSFNECIDWLVGRLDVSPGPMEKCIYYFEYMIPHTLHYAVDVIPRVVVFDIFDTKAASFLLPGIVKAECDRLGLPYVNEINVLLVSDIIGFGVENLQELIQESGYGAPKMEGIILKNYNRTDKWGQPLFAKVVAPEFKEVQDVPADDDVGDELMRDSTRFCESYFTDARACKVVFGLLEAGLPLDRALMKEAPMRLVYDAVVENFSEIFRGHRFNKLDLGSIKRAAAKLCLRTIDHVLLQHAQ